MAITTSYSMLLMPSMAKTIDPPCPAVFRWVSLSSFINSSIHRFIKKQKTIMARKRYFVTIEIEADVQNPRDTQQASNKLHQYISNGMKRQGWDYDFFIQNDNVISIFDERGKQL